MKLRTLPRFVTDHATIDAYGYGVSYHEAFHDDSGRQVGVICIRRGVFVARFDKSGKFEGLKEWNGRQ